MLTIHPSTQKLEPLHTHPTQIYALRIFGTFMAFNLISIMFTLEANTFMFIREFSLGLVKFYNWNFMFYENSSINYAGAENCSPFHPHDMLDSIEDFYHWPFCFFSFSHTHSDNYTRQSLLPFAEPCRGKNFLFYFCFVIPATLYQLLNISSHITTIMAARAFNHFSCWERFHCYVFLNNHENSFWAFLYCYLHFVVSSFTLHSLRNEKTLIVRIISI